MVGAMAVAGAELAMMMRMMRERYQAAYYTFVRSLSAVAFGVAVIVSI